MPTEAGDASIAVSAELDAQLRESLALLLGHYLWNDGNGQRLFHKIVAIAASQLGCTVF